jgi:hypothetical protein
MIVDALCLLSSAQAVTATAVSTNSYDLGIGREVADEGELFIVTTVGTTVTAAGAATVQIQFIQSANADLSSATIVAQTDAIPKASLVAGFTITNPIPRGITARYIGVNYVVATGPLTAGTFTANILVDAQDNRRYPTNFAIL